MSLLNTFGVSQIAIFDFETTGLSHEADFPTEIGIKLIGFDGHIFKPFVKRYSSLIRLPHGVEIPENITKFTGLTTEKVNREGGDVETVKLEILNFLGAAGVNGTMWIAHNANFDLGFLSTHFGIEPEHFLCTRTIEILTAPDCNASLKNVYAAYYPELGGKQEHRAMADIEMTHAILEKQLFLHSDEVIAGFFKNKLVNMPDRELGYVPPHSKVLDFAKRYVSVNTHKDALEAAEKYERLEAYGVDNWSGYGMAMSDEEGIFEEDN